MNIVRGFVLFIIAMMGFAFSFVMIATISVAVLTRVFVRPEDPSSGDGVAWLLIFSFPLTVPMDALISLIVAVLVYSFASRRL